MAYKRKIRVACANNSCHTHKLLVSLNNVYTAITSQHTSKWFTSHVPMSSVSLRLVRIRQDSFIFDNTHWWFARDMTHLYVTRLIRLCKNDSRRCGKTHSYVTILIDMWQYSLIIILAHMNESRANHQWDNTHESTRPYESCKIFKGRLRRNAFFKTGTPPIQIISIWQILSGGNPKHNWVE